jgi:hypothetical protein
MDIIVFPFDYDEEKYPSVIPIGIRDTDDAGRPVYLEWFFRGVPPVADMLLDIAGRVLGDRHRGSEITEYAIHGLSRDHGQDLGETPGYRILGRAHDCAEDLRVGGRRARRTADVELLDETVDALQEQYDFVAALIATDTLDRLIEQLTRMRETRIIEMISMMLRGCEAWELAKRYGQRRNTITKQLFRKTRLAAKLAGISW